MTDPGYDLAVVGGGITGVGVARLAARNGLRVVLLEQGDLASGASSATSHMLHGGLRYLERGQFVLVREALAERAAVRRMAPGLVQPTRFLVPFYRGDRRRPWMVRLGLTVYDTLAAGANLAPHAGVRAREALELEPDLEPRELIGAGLYSDAVMDDARLAVAVARDAVAQGAEIITYTRVIGARPLHRGGVALIARGVRGGPEQRFAAGAIINAAGADADQVRTLLLCALEPGRPDPEPLLRPTRGVHLIFPPLTRRHGLVLFARADGRVFFLVPFRGRTLVGTTEVEVASPPRAEDRVPSAEEVRYLGAELGRVLPGMAEQPVLAATAGLRPLLRAEGRVVDASREHQVVIEGRLITIVGGKYTTFRRMAWDVLERAKRAIGREVLAIRDSCDPLPVANAPHPTIEALAEHAAEREFARTVEDVVRRRSALWLTPDRGRVAAPAIAAALGRRLGWSPEREREELQTFHAALEREERSIRRSRGEA